MIRIEMDFLRVRRKNGQMGALRCCWLQYCPLNWCDVCGKSGPAGRVRQRNDVWGWNRARPNDYGTPSKSTLCMKCWNRARAVVRARDAAAEVHRLTNKLKREVQEWQRKQASCANP